MSTPLPPLKFALPPSVSTTRKDTRVQKLMAYLSQSLGREAEIVLTKSYRDLTTQTQVGRLDFAWSPPFVAARLESAGLRVVLRGVRRGASFYRAALLASHPEASLSWLKGRRAAWVDPYSVAGCLLPAVFLRANGFDPDRDFTSQEFVGSYVAAAERVAAGKADVTSVYAPPPGIVWHGQTGLDELAPELALKLRVIAHTDVVPNSGLVVSPKVDVEAVSGMQRALKALKGSPDGPLLLEQLFQMDEFEDAPRMGYHALYRLAVASL